MMADNPAPSNRKLGSNMTFTVTTFTDNGAGTAGRGLLFGNSAADTLHGGGQDDILSSGGFTCTSPLDRAALNAVRLAWRSQSPYADRVADLTVGTAPSNQCKLDATTYQSDLAVDALFGDLDTDWFLVDDPSEVADLAVGETATDLA